MKMTLLKIDGTKTEIDADTVVSVEKILNAGFLDVVDLRNGTVMFVDDNSHSIGLPVNHAATKLYHSICRPDTTFEIRGNVVIAIKPKPSTYDLSQHKFDSLRQRPV